MADFGRARRNILTIAGLYLSMANLAKPGLVGKPSPDKASLGYFEEAVACMVRVDSHIEEVNHMLEDLVDELQLAEQRVMLYSMRQGAGKKDEIEQQEASIALIEKNKEKRIKKHLVKKAGGQDGK